MADEIKTQTILFVGIAESDGLSLGKIFLASNLQPHGVCNCHEAIEFLDQHKIPVVLTEPELPDGSWRKLLDYMAKHAAPPNLIVSCRLPDDRLWAEVLTMGGYDLLATPFEAGEVLRVTSAAQNNWGYRQVEGCARRATAGSPES